jgi:hypothetical protein
VPNPEELVAEVVAEVSSRMQDPAYAQVAIGAFIEAHPEASRFVALKMTARGGAEAAMHALFHAQVVAECVARHRGVDALAPLCFADLDAVAEDARGAGLAAKEPALAGYLQSNIDEPKTEGVIAHLALALARPG